MSRAEAPDGAAAESFIQADRTLLMRFGVLRKSPLIRGSSSSKRLAVMIYDDDDKMNE